MAARLANIWAIAGFVIAGAPLPAFAQEDPRIVEALAAREAGDLAGAVRRLEAIEAERPGDPTVLRLLGSSYAAAGQYDRGISTLERARTIAPRDQDISLALARAFLWADRLDQAAAIAGEIAAADPTNVELPELRLSIDRARRSAPARSAGIALAFTHSWVEVAGDTRHWNQAVVSADTPIGRRTTMTGEADLEDRAGVTDTRLSVLLDHRLSPAASVSLAAMVTPRADFREKWGVRAGADIKVTPFLALTAAVRHADYGATNVTVIEPGVRLQTPDERASLSVRSINSWGESNDYRSGWSVRGDLVVRGGVRLIAGGATYPDTEAGITRRVRGLFGAAVVPINSRLGLRIGADYEKRVASYERTGATLGLTWRFGP
jgi:YaiO family outer membrane protein